MTGIRQGLQAFAQLKKCLKMSPVLLSKSTRGRMYTTKCYPGRDAHWGSLVCLRYRLPQLWPAPPAECLEILHEITITVMACYCKSACPQI